jgi:hypothetical protein
VLPYVDSVSNFSTATKKLFADLYARYSTNNKKLSNRQVTSHGYQDNILRLEVAQNDELNGSGSETSPTTQSCTTFHPQALQTTSLCYHLNANVDYIFMRHRL